MYVHPHGDDDGSGGACAPVRSVARAIALLNPRWAREPKAPGAESTESTGLEKQAPASRLRKMTPQKAPTPSGAAAGSIRLRAEQASTSRRHVTRAAATGSLIPTRRSNDRIDSDDTSDSDDAAERRVRMQAPLVAKTDPVTGSEMTPNLCSKLVESSAILPARAEAGERNLLHMAGELEMQGRRR